MAGWNRNGPAGDDGGVNCDQAREAVSAMLDGQEPGSSRAEVTRHLDGCGDCRRWQHDAARVTRLVRLAPADDRVDVTAAVLDRIRLPRFRRLRRVLRVALLAVALVQLAVGIIGLTPVVIGSGPTGEGIPTMGADGHLGHELAAFNLAVAVALLWVAVQPRRARDPLPLLAAFVLVLAAMSAGDLLAGRVGWDRLASHLPIVAGLVLAALLARLGPDGARPGGAAGDDVPASRVSTAPDDVEPPGQEASPPTPPAAHRESA